MSWFKRLFGAKEVPKANEQERARPEPLEWEKKAKANQTKSTASSSGAPVGLMVEIMIGNMSPMEKERAWLDPTTGTALKDALKRELRGRTSFFQ